MMKIMKQIAIKIVNKSPTVKPIVLTECSIFDFDHFEFYQRCQWLRLQPNVYRPTFPVMRRVKSHLKASMSDNRLMLFQLLAFTHCC